MQDYDIDAECVGVDAVGVGVATINAFSDSGMTVQALSGGNWSEAIPMEVVSQGGKIVTKPMYRFRTPISQMYCELRENFNIKSITRNKSYSYS